MRLNIVKKLVHLITYKIKKIKNSNKAINSLTKLFYLDKLINSDKFYKIYVMLYKKAIKSIKIY